MDKKEIKKIKDVLKKYSKIKLVYFFGSRNRGKFNSESDYDFAMHVNEKDSVKIFKLRLKLMNEFSRILKNDNIDIIILNDIDNPTLKYEVLTEGTLIYDVEPYKLMILPQILNEYEDFILTHRRN